MKASRKYIMGVDPGLTGAIALMELSTADLVSVHDIPTLQLKKKKKIDVYSLVQLLDSMSQDTQVAVVEEVTASPQMGVVSAFNFGFGTGLLHAAIASSFMTIKTIKPSIWKPALGLNRDKNKSRERAIKLWPKQAHLFARKKDDGRAEAALLAWFGAKHDIR